MAGIVNNQQSLGFSFNQGTLHVKDISEEYSGINFSNYVCLDYLIRNDRITNMIVRENINSQSDILLNEFILKEDGEYEYYRMLIPRAKKYIDGIKNGSIFYYKQKVYISSTDSSLVDINNCKEIDYLNLYQTLENNTSEVKDVIYVQYILFCYEKLKQKYLDIQQKYVDSLSFGNKADKSIREKRDILLTTLILIREYVNNDLFDDAEKVLYKIESNSCLDIIESTNKSICGCTEVNTEFKLEVLYNIIDDDLVKSEIWTFGDSFPIYFK